MSALENIGDRYSMVLLFSDGVVTCGKEEWEKVCVVPIWEDLIIDLGSCV